MFQGFELLLKLLLLLPEKEVRVKIGR